MPTLRGYGTLPSLHIAMSNDPTLLGLVQDLTEAWIASQFSQNEDIREIMWRWAGVDGVSSSSRGGNIDARDLEFLEAFIGHQVLSGGNPDYAQAPHFQQAFDIIYEQIASRLEFQILGASSAFTGGGTYDPVSEMFTAATSIDFDNLETLMSSVTSFDDQLSLSKMIVTWTEETIGISNLSSSDYDDLNALMAPGATIEELQHSIVGDSFNTFGDSYDNLIIASGAVHGYDGNDLLIGDSFSDTFYGGYGNDYLIGGAGSDSFYGDGGNDTIDPGSGNDTITAGPGGDTVIFADGYGHDTYYENANEGTDTIRVVGLSPEEVRLMSEGNLVIVNDNDQYNYITIPAGTTGYAGTHYETTIGQYVERIVFDDGTIWDLTGGLTLKIGPSVGAMSGTQYNDVIYGGDGNDDLYGNRGDDQFFGDDGADYYTSEVGTAMTR